MRRKKKKTTTTTTTKARGMQREERDSGHPLFECLVDSIALVWFYHTFVLDSSLESRVKRAEENTQQQSIAPSAASSASFSNFHVFCKRRKNRQKLAMIFTANCQRLFLLVVFLCAFVIHESLGVWKRREDKTKCPKVKGIRNFDVSEFLGSWYIVQYYASSEEALAYRCMRAELSVSPESAEITMNFTYSFTDDPINELLIGNITWKIPSSELPAHWVHAELPYEGVYNTYVLDSDYKSWALLMHCAEKSKSPRYLSSFIMSREPNLGANVISYLREKLPKYDIDLEYMFPMEQANCNQTSTENDLLPPTVLARRNYTSRRHPLKRKHKNP